MERYTEHITRLLRQQEFSSLDEANAFLAGPGGEVAFLPPRTPMEEAQDLVYDAWEAPTKRQRVSLARKALKIFPDCADAYSILADAARTAEEALDLYQ